MLTCDELEPGIIVWQQEEVRESEIQNKEEIIYNEKTLQTNLTYITTCYMVVSMSPANQQVSRDGTLTPV